MVPQRWRPLPLYAKTLRVAVPESFCMMGEAAPRNVKWAAAVGLCPFYIYGTNEEGDDEVKKIWVRGADAPLKQGLLRRGRCFGYK